MVYALEYLKFQGTECCPQYRWKQFAICGSRAPLDKVRVGQPRPADWRVVFLPGSAQAAIEQLRKTA